MHFNPRAPYGARLLVLSCHGLDVPISIHAPHTGRDHVQLGRPQLDAKFQSTRPIRGATHIKGICLCVHHYFNPRAPYGARLAAFIVYVEHGVISIHAPHTGRDITSFQALSQPNAFQSTRPIRGATIVFHFVSPFCYYFNPRAPYGARH